MEDNVYSILRFLMTSVGIAGVVYCVFKICGQKIKYKHELNLENMRNKHEILLIENRLANEKLKNSHEIEVLNIKMKN